MYSRSVQVGDLLNKVGSDDLITREHQPLPTIENSTSTGLDITMKIYSVNHSEVWISIIGARASFDEVCDYSGVDYVRELVIGAQQEEVLRFALKPYEDDVYPINSRDNTISLLDPITQLVRLYEPVSKVAPGYEFTIEDEEEETGNRVVFK